MSNKQIGVAYAGAVATSCTLALGLGHVVNNAHKYKFSPFTTTAIRTIVPYIAVASAGAVNVGLMRKNEMDTGITVVDEHDKPQGQSKIAGRMALQQVALTRVALAAPIMILPPVILGVLNRYGLMPNAKTAPRSNKAVQVGVIAACLWGALPTAIGLFPQTSAVDPLKLESEFHHVKDEKGNPLRMLYFNKGL